MSEKQEAVCFGTKERYPCGCGGDKDRCTFYSEVREKAKQEVHPISIELFRQLIFDCAMDLEYGYKDKEDLVNTLINLSNAKLT